MFDRWKKCPKITCCFPFKGLSSANLNHPPPPRPHLHNVKTGSQSVASTDSSSNRIRTAAEKLPQPQESAEQAESAVGSRTAAREEHAAATAVAEVEEEERSGSPATDSGGSVGVGGSESKEFCHEIFEVPITVA